MRSKVFILTRVVLWAVLVGLIVASAQAKAAQRAVSLQDARVAPTYLVYLWPHGSVTYARGSDGHNCQHGGFFSDVSAYTWKGGELSDQHWSKHRQLAYWHDDKGKRVTFDGITFRNHTRARVLVGAWCGK